MIIRGGMADGSIVEQVVESISEQEREIIQARKAARRAERIKLLTPERANIMPNQNRHR